MTTSTRVLRQWVLTVLLLVMGVATWSLVRHSSRAFASDTTSPGLELALSWWNHQKSCVVDLNDVPRENWDEALSAPEVQFVLFRNGTLNAASLVPPLSDKTGALTLVVTSTVVEHFEALAALAPRLTGLSLRGCALDNAAMETIARLQNLRYLDLSDTGMRNRWLPHLSALEELSSLDVSGTHVRDVPLRPHAMGLVDSFLDDTPRGRAREDRAKQLKSGILKDLFASAGLSYPPKRLFFRVFKEEREFEVWASDDRRGPMDHLATYTVCHASGKAGPKTRQGDGQVPEGFYRLDALNRNSNYFLSMHVNYPNELDRKLRRTGSAIMVHGNCVSIGCMAMSDDRIMELYLMVKDSGLLPNVPIHIFPQRDMEQLLLEAPEGKLQTFWASLERGLRFFEETGEPPRVRVEDSTYRLDPVGDGPADEGLAPLTRHEGLRVRMGNPPLDCRVVANTLECPLTNDPVVGDHPDE